MSEGNKILGAQPRFDDVDSLVDDIRAVLAGGDLTQGAQQAEFVGDRSHGLAQEFAQVGDR